MSQRHTPGWSRRQFIHTAAALGVGATYGPRLTPAAGNQNAKANVACVGISGMGGYPVGIASKYENLVALCDVDQVRAGKTLEKNDKAARFTDYRVMIDKMGKEIDAIAISTPDHTHFPAAMAAMEAGKHVFVQKPLAHNIWQVRTLEKAAARYKVHTQMGNQGHTFDGMRRIKEWVDGGVVGEVREVITWTDRPRMPWFVKDQAVPAKTAPVPATLDWDLWQGPTTERDYSPDYLPTKWRGWWDYGCGSLGDIGCHTFDAPFYVLGLGMPTKVEVEMKPPTNDQYIPWGSVVTYHFPARGKKPPVVLKWYEAGYDVPKPKGWEGEFKPKEGGMAMHGSKETLFHYGMRPNSPQIIPNARAQDLKKTLFDLKKLPSAVGGPVEEWLAAIKGEIKETGSPFSYAAPLTEVVLLGALAQRTGKTIEWDAENMRVKGQPELDRYIKEPVRKGWEYGESI